MKAYREKDSRRYRHTNGSKVHILTDKSYIRISEDGDIFKTKSTPMLLSEIQDEITGGHFIQIFTEGNNTSFISKPKIEEIVDCMKYFQADAVL